MMIILLKRILLYVRREFRLIVLFMVVLLFYFKIIRGRKNYEVGVDIFYFINRILI